MSSSLVIVLVLLLVIDAPEFDYDHEHEWAIIIPAPFDIRHSAFVIPYIPMI